MALLNDQTELSSPKTKPPFSSGEARKNAKPIHFSCGAALSAIIFPGICFQFLSMIGLTSVILNLMAA